MDKKEINGLNRKGWIPGPKEEEGPFFKRIEKLLHFYSHPPQDVDHFLTDPEWEGALEKTEELYDFRPDWIVAHYSNEKLPFYQGAATWIAPKGEIQIPLIQLREKFESGGLFKIYKRDEVLSHEAVHAVRMEFEEPRFEEIFAYKTSPYCWRRFFGPLFQHSYESTLFLLFLLVPLLIQTALFFVPHLEKWAWVGFLPLVYGGFLLGRLLFYRFTLFAAGRRLHKFLALEEKKWATLIRLTDKEIFLFAYGTPTQIEGYLRREKSLRWKLLREIYFKKKL